MINKKIADNNVESFEEVIVKDINGDDKTILEYKESFGQDKIDDQKAKAELDLKKANAIVETKKLAEVIADAQKKVDNIKAVMAIYETETKTDKDGNDFEAYVKNEELEQAGYSQEVLIQAEKELVKADKFNAIKYKMDKIKEAEDKLGELKKVQSEMDKIFNKQKNGKR